MSLDGFAPDRRRPAVEGVTMAINYRNVLTERIRASGMRAVLESLSDETGPLAAK